MVLLCLIGWSCSQTSGSNKRQQKGECWPASGVHTAKGLLPLLALPRKWCWLSGPSVFFFLHVCLSILLQKSFQSCPVPSPGVSVTVTPVGGGVAQMSLEMGGICCGPSDWQEAEFWAHCGFHIAYFFVHLPVSLGVPGWWNSLPSTEPVLPG